MAKPKPASRRPAISVVHGPNLNLLGEREPHIYGRITLAEIDGELRRRGEGAGVDVYSVQSNHEGALIDFVQDARHSSDVLIVNAGGFAHTSVALRDAIAGIGLPAIEVHLSNLAAREDFRQRTLLGAVCVGQVSGFGARSYWLALDGAIGLLKEKGRLAQ